MQRPLSPRFAVFCCPICRERLAAHDRALICAGGHSFDLARSGYVNLMRNRSRTPAAGGDTRAQLERRARFLAKGHFDFIGEAIAAMAGEAGSCQILDIGCGTGFHLARVMERLAARAPAAAGIDLSKDAAVWCARRHPDLDFAVADIWDCWPIHDNSVDVVSSIFAPKNFAEMARVLRPSGLLAIVFPGPRHFQELRRAFDLLGLSEGKTERYAAQIAAHLRAPVQHRVARRTMFDQEDIRNAVLMGPNARHGIEARDGPAWMAVTIDVEFLFVRRPQC